jgi:threonylcarbamoyladenosine tRNA methylthiotransferase MtaB
VKVQDGCDNRCAYCIVPDARGVPRSVPAEYVVARVAGLHASGTAEVVLTGVNIGTYGAEGAPDLAALVKLVAATGVRRIRISSIEPPDLSERLLEVLAALPAVAPHLHVPLQSGCDRTLAAMGRRYDTASYACRLSLARDALPGLAVTSDVIAGFPGETDEDFAASAGFIEACGFAKLHVFRYSRRSGTPAATAPDQVTPAVKAVRARTLREMSGRFERAHANARAGQPAMLLVEAVRDGCARGTTEDYLRVSAESPGARAGDLVRVVLGQTADGAPRGYYVGERRA